MHTCKKGTFCIKSSVNTLVEHSEAQSTEYTPSPWLTLLLVLGKTMLTKFRVNQVKWYQFIQNQVKSVLVKEFLLHSTC